MARGRKKTDKAAPQKPADQLPPAGGSDVALAAAQSHITPAPGPSTQADQSTTQTGSPIITDENPVVVPQEPGLPGAPQPTSSEGGETGQQAMEKAAATEESTWTPSAALAPQNPTTLAESDLQQQKEALSRK